MREPESDRLLAGLRKIGRYSQIERIASGGMGRIYRAFDSETNRTVAIKVLAPEARRNPQAVVRFREEVCAAAKLRDTHVVTLYDSGEVGDTLYYVMEFVEGHTLGNFVSANDPPLKRRVELILAVARGVEAMHRADILHRDLKPDNILVTTQGVPIIIDLGVAKRVAATDRAVQTLAGTSIGTPLYMPPEQVRYDAERVGKPSDVYSLGVLSYQILTGRFPYGAANRALGLGQDPDKTIESDAVGLLFGEILDEPPIPPRSFLPDFPAGLERILMMALAKDPEERYPDAGEYARALATWLRPTTGMRRSPIRPAVTSSGRRRLAWTAVALVAAAGIGAGSVLVFRGDEEPPRPRRPLAAFADALASSPARADEIWLASRERDRSFDEVFRRLSIAATVHRDVGGLEGEFEELLGVISRGGDIRPAVETFLTQLARRQLTQAGRDLDGGRFDRVLPRIEEILSYRPETADEVLSAESVDRGLLMRFGWAFVDAGVAGAEPDGASLETAVRFYERASRDGEIYARRDLAIAHLLLARLDRAQEALDEASAKDYLLPAARAWLAIARADLPAARTHLAGKRPVDRRWLDWLAEGLLAEAEGRRDDSAHAYDRALEEAWYLRPYIVRRRDAQRT